MGTGGQRTHLAVSHNQQALSPQAGQHTVNGWHIQGIIGLFPRYHINGQGQFQRIEGGHHGFDLPQRRIIFAVAELPEALLSSVTIP